jgi:hypothetical protein
MRLVLVLGLMFTCFKTQVSSKHQSMCSKFPTLERKKLPVVPIPRYNPNSTINKLFTDLFKVAMVEETSHNISCFKWNCVSSEGECRWCLPYVFIGGFSKCGTTSFCAKLKAHPDIKPYRHKEMNLFAKLPEDFSLKAFERRILDNHKDDPGSLMIDCTSGAYREIDAVANLLQFSPNTKVIYLVRDPWQRMGSWLTMARRSEREERFDNVYGRWKDVLKTETPQTQKRFNLATIQHVSSLFPMNAFMFAEILLFWQQAFKSNILVIDHYDLEHNPAAVMRRTEDFLQITHHEYGVDVLLDTSVNTMIKVDKAVDSDSFEFVQNDTDLSRKRRRNISKKGIKIRTLNETSIHEPYTFQDKTVLGLTRKLFGPSLCLFEKVFGWSIKLVTESEIHYFFGK